MTRHTRKPGSKQKRKRAVPKVDLRTHIKKQVAEIERLNRKIADLGGEPNPYWPLFKAICLNEREE